MVFIFDVFNVKLILCFVVLFIFLMLFLVFISLDCLNVFLVVFFVDRMRFKFILVCIAFLIWSATLINFVFFVVVWLFFMNDYVLLFLLLFFISVLSVV